MSILAGDSGAEILIIDEAMSALLPISGAGKVLKTVLRAQHRP